MPDSASQSDFLSHVQADWKQAHNIWTNIKAYIDALVPVTLATPVDLTGSMTWDDAEHSLDLTSSTSANARWAIISVYMTKSTDWRNPLYIRAASGGANVISIGGDQSVIDTADGSSKAYYIGAGGLWVPIDSGQLLWYVAPSVCTDKKVYLLGYSGARQG